MNLGTCVVAGVIVPVLAVELSEGRIQFVVRLGPEVEIRHLEREEYRIHGTDGSLVTLVDRVSTQPIRKRRGEWMTLTLPMRFVDNRAIQVGE